MCGAVADVRFGFRRAAAYVDKILRGANPADLPVEQPTKFEFGNSETCTLGRFVESDKPESRPGATANASCGAIV
jgi:hypothetical protein